MASIRDLRKRITTVKNTQQTTKAMKMVSAAKLRRSQEAIFNNRPFAWSISRLIRLISMIPEAEIETPLIAGPGYVEKPLNEKRIVLVAITSDRGLCGGFNSNINKATLALYRKLKNEAKSVELVFIGRKASEFYKARGVTKPLYYSEVGAKATFDKAHQLSQFLIDYFLSGKCDEVQIVYNEFKNAISQKITNERFLPVSRAEAVPSEKNSQPIENAELYIVKPGPKAVMETLLKKYFATQAFRILLESQASEHGARMGAMENATKNAGEMIKKLTLQYNKQRQAGITKELLEIISGSESQKSA